MSLMTIVQFSSLLNCCETDWGSLDDRNESLAHASIISGIKYELLSCKLTLSLAVAGKDQSAPFNAFYDWFSNTPKEGYPMTDAERIVFMMNNSCGMYRRDHTQPTINILKAFFEIINKIRWHLHDLVTVYDPSAVYKHQREQGDIDRVGG